MHWIAKALLWVVGFALAYYPLVFVFIAGLFAFDAIQKEAPREWSDLWRGKADAVVKEVRTRCSIREQHAEGSRRRYVTTDVPCERIGEELAVRPGAQSLREVREINLTFTTEDGRPIEAVSYSGILGLRDPVTAGQKVRVSYDRERPDHLPHAARGIGALLTLALLYAALTVVSIAVWRWLRRRVSGLSGRFGGYARRA